MKPSEQIQEWLDDEDEYDCDTGEWNQLVRCKALAENYESKVGAVVNAAKAVIYGEPTTALVGYMEMLDTAVKTLEGTSA